VSVNIEAEIGGIFGDFYPEPGIRGYGERGSPGEALPAAFAGQLYGELAAITLIISRLAVPNS